MRLVKSSWLLEVISFVNEQSSPLKSKLGLYLFFLRHLRFVGDIAKTVNDIGFATFSSISTSADWYISSFKDNTMTAGISSHFIFDPLNFISCRFCVLDKVGD